MSAGLIPSAESNGIPSITNKGSFPADKEVAPLILKDMALPGLPEY